MHSILYLYLPWGRGRALVVSYWHYIFVSAMTSSFRGGARARRARIPKIFLEIPNLLFRWGLKLVSPDGRRLLAIQLPVPVEHVSNRLPKSGRQFPHARGTVVRAGDDAVVERKDRCDRVMLEGVELGARLDVPHTRGTVPRAGDDAVVNRKDCDFTLMSESV